MRTVGSYEAKTHLPRLLDEVAAGEEITITKNGKPVARLVPPVLDEAKQRHEAVEAMKRFRSEFKWRLPEGMTIRDMIEEGRKY